MKFYITVVLSILLSYAGIAQKDSRETSSKELKILMVLSNAGYYGKSDIKTANHFAELTVPYEEFVSAGYQVDFVSPLGGRVPVGYINTSDALMAKYIHNHDFMDEIMNTKKPSEITTEDYIAIFYVGGGAAMFGVPQDEMIQNIAMAIYEQHGGVVSAICHGTAGLVNLKTSNGDYLVNGKKVNGFPDLFEDLDAKYYKEFPFSIQEAIKDRNGDFVYSEDGWDNYYVLDGRLATGQDPSSAKILAQRIIGLIESL